MHNLNCLIESIEARLLTYLDIESINNSNPIVVNYIPGPWILLGVGNYAAVLLHPEFTEYVVKVYAPNRPGIEDEVKIYHKIKKHSFFSECFHHNKNYLILKRLRGETLYSCINKGIPIPEQVIKDIDEALIYAKNLGLHPHDVHVKNIILIEDRGVVADISDFNKPETCELWEDFKKAYYKIYLPLLYKSHIGIPELYLNLIRKGYRLFKRLKYR